MDEIDILRKLKKFIIITFFLVLGIILALEVYAQVVGYFIWSEFVGLEIYDILFLSSLFWMALVVPAAIGYVYLSIKFKKNRIQFENVDKITREVVKECPPAICSFLYNKKTIAYINYTATILNLENKGIIKVESKNDNYEITILKKEVNLKNRHEQYVLECIKNMKNFEISKFKQMIANDAIDSKLAYSKVSKKNVPKVVLYIAIFIGFILEMIIKNTELFGIWGIVCVVVYLIILYSKNKSGDDAAIIYKLTDKGKTIRKEILGLKLFMKEYTLLDKRQMEEKELFGEYIAYALALGEADVVQKFISSNEKYRSLIYKN